EGGKTKEEVDLEESLGAIVTRTYAVGKLIEDRRVSLSQIRSQIHNIWYIKGDFSLIPKPNGVYLISFEHEEDKRKVVIGAPWLVSNMHFSWKDWKIIKLGDAFPVFHYYKPSLDSILGWQGFVRARVEVEINRPLRLGVCYRGANGKYYPTKRQGAIVTNENNDTNMPETEVRLDETTPAVSSSQLPLTPMAIVRQKCKEA
ncbi:hypothetical protein Tsubulata_032068, partial [Turnera subulata]